MAEISEEYKAHVEALLAPVKDEIAALRAEMAKLAAHPTDIVSMAGCVCSYTWSDTGIIRNGPRADCPAHGGAMAEAQDHPGRIVTR